jgi:hypothetical protein
MIDIFQKKERHIYAKSFGQTDNITSMREFGPQDQDDLLN